MLILKTVNSYRFRISLLATLRITRLILPAKRPFRYRLQFRTISQSDTARYVDGEGVDSDRFRFGHRFNRRSDPALVIFSDFSFLVDTRPTQYAALVTLMGRISSPSYGHRSISGIDLAITREKETCGSRLEYRVPSRSQTSTSTKRRNGRGR